MACHCKLLSSPWIEAILLLSEIGVLEGNGTVIRWTRAARVTGFHAYQERRLPPIWFVAELKIVLSTLKGCFCSLLVAAIHPTTLLIRSFSVINFFRWNLVESEVSNDIFCWSLLRRNIKYLFPSEVGHQKFKQPRLGWYIFISPAHALIILFVYERCLSLGFFFVRTLATCFSCYCYGPCRVGGGQMFACVLPRSGW